MFLSTTAKHSAAKSQNIIMLKIAKHAKNGFATNTADMYQNTTGNMYVEIKDAQIHAQQLLAAINLPRNRAVKS
jgi:hypothetical protein